MRMEQKSPLKRRFCSTVACGRLVDCSHSIPQQCLSGSSPQGCRMNFPPSYVFQEMTESTRSKSWPWNSYLSALLHAPGFYTDASTMTQHCLFRIWLPGLHNGTPTLLHLSENDRVRMEQKSPLKRRFCSTVACGRLVDCSHKYISQQCLSGSSPQGCRMNFPPSYVFQEMTESARSKSWPWNSYLSALLHAPGFYTDASTMAQHCLSGSGSLGCTMRPPPFFGSQTLTECAWSKICP